jgi:hypothetical protein
MSIDVRVESAGANVVEEARIGAACADPALRKQRAEKRTEEIRRNLR